MVFHSRSANFIEEVYRARNVSSRDAAARANTEKSVRGGQRKRLEKQNTNNPLPSLGGRVIHTGWEMREHRPGYEATN